MGFDWLVFVGFLLLVGGVIGSIAPVVPGPVLSISGIYLYWYSTGYQSPGWVLLVILTVVGVVGVLVDWLAPMIASRIGGASNYTIGVSTLVGTIGLFLFGPAGLLIGLVLTALLVELYRSHSLFESLSAASAALMGVLAAPVFQAFITSALLVSMTAVVIL